ncbi:cytochrome b/b6 domain-containing protein [Futiania mangrovi]|uniref:Cytochrome b/b6 domain-containing protein n=1 Tax=Futiania mangrovi TaxID=2959716 RepID=A0A9J6PAM9_9PROT|nr:cytochrome b/b6 domain-containing protein [Futiania mangrovii]MCP1335118.1 cytochrome b/b6 domain-containing protein [Futiania mangrovii]
MAGATIRVWDPLVRIFHWTLVASFAVAWATAEDRGGLHEWAGYAAAALITFRLAWGLAGPKYARFRQFVRAPSEVLGYLKASLRGGEPRYVGHNPAGGLMIVGLLAGLAGTALTGWMYTLDRFWGADWVEETHEALATLLLAMVGLHVAGALFASMRHGENLVRAMITGRKRAPGPLDIA